MFAKSGCPPAALPCRQCLISPAGRTGINSSRPLLDSPWSGPDPRIRCCGAGCVGSSLLGAAPALLSVLQLTAGSSGSFQKLVMFSRVPLKTHCCSSLCGGSRSQPLAEWMGLTPTSSEGEGPTSCFLKVTVSVYLPLGKKQIAFLRWRRNLRSQCGYGKHEANPRFVPPLIKLV